MWRHWTVNGSTHIQRAATTKRAARCGQASSGLLFPARRIVVIESSSLSSRPPSCWQRHIATAASCRRHQRVQDSHEGNEREEEAISSQRFAPPRPAAASKEMSPSSLGRDSSSLTEETAIVVDDKDTPQDAAPKLGRPMTMQERFRHFPFGVAALYLDCLRYKNIHDASRTRLNAWTLDPPYPRRVPTEDAAASDGSPFVLSRADRILHQDSMVPGRIPRRQHEQQRQLVEDLHVVLPLVVAWLPPIVGYLPMILAVLAPRQVLTRQFWNSYEVDLYAHQESIQRRHFFARVAELFWNATTNNRREPPFVVLGLDAAGPVIDPRPLFTDLHQNPNLVTSGNEDTLMNPYANFLTSVEALPDEYLVPLALACGSYASVGGTGRDDFLLPRLLAGWCTPRRWLQYRVRRTARAIADDDALLIEEGAHVNHCQDLTDLEVMDACLLRGLPLSRNMSDMRTSLSNHLAMMALIHLQASRHETRTGRGSTFRYNETFGLLSLHLSILRASLCRNCAEERAIRPSSNIEN